MAMSVARQAISDTTQGATVVMTDLAQARVVLVCCEGRAGYWYEPNDRKALRSRWLQRSA